MGGLYYINCFSQPRTPLELEVAALLQGSKNVLTQSNMLTAAEERALRAMNLEEVYLNIYTTKHTFLYF